jgi:CheY-like chemotaxis protein
MISKQQLNNTTLNTKTLINDSGISNNKEVIELLAKMKQQEALPPPERTILIVEDNQIYREMISSILQKEGFVIDEAEDGLKAINKIKENEYTLIIMDLFMPNLDGLNTTRHIIKLKNGNKTPIIALSGNKRKELVQKWASHGLYGYIMKPSTKSEIL